MIALTGALLWLSLRSLNAGDGESKTEFLISTWKAADKFYLFLMAAVLMLSHILRAERWRMLLVPTGNKVKIGNSLLSLMIGYLVNLAIPRGGEFSRCYNLYKLENTPVEVSFGTVVAERVVDVMCLLILIVMSFVLEWTKLLDFIQSLSIQSEGSYRVPVWLITAILIGIAIVIALYFIRRNERVKKIFSGFRQGLLAIFQVKSKWLFIFHSVGIWGLYYLMTYFVIKAFPETSTLGLSAVLTLFAIGGIAMAVPLPGGAGSYHTLVPLGLVMLYGLPQADAIAFVFIYHAWQTAMMIVGGVVSLIISYALVRWRKPQEK